MATQSKYSKFLSNQAHFFDEMITEDWEAYISPYWDYVRKYEIKQLFRHAVKPEKILDIGCGCGFHNLFMAEHPGVQRVDAIDYSAKSIERAESTFPHPKVRRFVADFRSYKPKEPYDLITSFQVYEHLDTPKDYWEFCRTYTRTGGAIAIFTSNGPRLENSIRRILGMPQTYLDPQHFKEYSAQELKATAQEYGFKPVKLIAYGLTIPKMRGIRDKLGPRLNLALGKSLPSLADQLGFIAIKI